MNDKTQERAAYHIHKVRMPCILAIDVMQTVVDLANDTITDPMYVIAASMALDALKREAAEVVNDPLTLEELRGMGGEPVWIQFGDGVEGNAILEIDGESVVLHGPAFDDHVYPDTDFINMEYNDPAGHFGLHLLGWRAYRRKPEGGGE